MEQSEKFRLREPLLALAGAVIFIIWLVNAFNTGNLLWFLPYQPTYQPTRIVVHNYGQTESLQPGMPGFQELADALTETFAAGFDSNALVSIGLSDETLMRYNESELVVEAFYADEVRFNTPVRMVGVNQLLIPIDATHAGNRYLFMGTNGKWRAGALVMTDDTPLMRAMVETGYLAEE